MPDSLDEERKQMSDLLTDLEQEFTAAQRSSKQRITKVIDIVNRITSISYHQGLTPPFLERLIDLITLPNGLDQISRVNLINNLYPASKVPDSVIFRVVASLGHGTSKVSYSVQATLLRWLIMTYDKAENQSAFSQVYGILFNLLDTTTIRPQLCHILSIISRRKHVQPFRIQILMELIHQTGNEPALIGYLKVFKHYFPDIIVGQSTDGRASVFSHPNPVWRDRLCEIQKQAGLITQQRIRHDDKVCKLFQNRCEYNKKLPELGITMTQNSDIQESSIYLEEIQNIRDFVRKFEKIYLPNQLVVVLRDPLLQKFLQLKSSKSDYIRVNNWLLAFFEDELLKKSSQNRGILEIFQLILEYTHRIKVLPSACISFFKCMIPSWDGLEDREIILDLLTYAPLDSYKSLSDKLFHLLEDAVLDDESINSKLDLVKFYTTLLNRWTVQLTAKSATASEIEASVIALAEHCNKLALTTLQISSSITTMSVILTFYETVASLTQNVALYPSLKLVLPEPEAIYILTFTSSLSILSRICGILAIYKSALDHNLPKGQIKATTTCVNNFNAYLIDLCNFLWRSRALNHLDLYAKGCLLSPVVFKALDFYLKNQSENSLSLSSLFSLSFSPVTCLFAITYFREEENRRMVHFGLVQESSADGPVTQSVLKRIQRKFKQEKKEKYEGISISWQDYKLGVLNFLENKGAPGLSELIHSTLKNLNHRRRENEKI